MKGREKEREREREREFSILTLGKVINLTDLLVNEMKANKDNDSYTVWLLWRVLEDKGRTWVNESVNLKREGVSELERERGGEFELHFLVSSFAWLLLLFWCKDRIISGRFMVFIVFVWEIESNEKYRDSLVCVWLSDSWLRLDHIDYIDWMYRGYQTINVCISIHIYLNSFEEFQHIPWVRLQRIHYCMRKWLGKWASARTEGFGL